MKNELNVNRSTLDDLTPEDFNDEIQDRESDYVNDLNEERLAIIKNGGGRCFFSN